MADGEAPEKVRRANEVRWKERAKMVKVERKLTKRLKEDLRQKPFIPEPSLHSNLSEKTALERCGECDQCKAPDCGTCGNCQREGPRATRAQSRGIGGAKEVRELAREPTPTTILQFFMGNVHRCQ